MWVESLSHKQDFCLAAITEFIILVCNYLFMCLPLPQACNLFKGRDHALHFCILGAGTVWKNEWTDSTI